ncbi:hypothetical protein [Nonomuraea sp. NPDC049158]|uniref:hypothetical protein n=1 Tax=Nonomuraea sp. NPDC049158 TaxID=3155649 RepID=UPI0033F8FB4D
MNTAPHQGRIWPTVESIPVSAVTDKPPGHLAPVRTEDVAGTVGTGRDTAGGAGAATGVGTAGARPRGARANPAAELGFSGDPEQRGDPGDDMLHAQRVWDASLAANRLDAAGVAAERQRVATADVTASVSLIVDGWPEDVRASIESVIEHTGAHVLALDLGDVDGAGEVLHELALRHPDRITEWRVAETPHWRGGSATWGGCRAKLLRLDTSEVHVLMETSVVLTGDALTPLVAAVADGAVAAGWHGLERPPDGTEIPPGGTERSLDDIEADNIEASQGGLERPLIGAGWHEAGPGRVRALRGDLMAVRRSAALGALPEDARDGENADLELSLALKGELVVPSDRLPVRRLRHPEARQE